MSTDPRRLERQLRRHFYAGIKRYALIEKGDSILLGLSGGKDSLALLDLLGEAMKRSGRQFDVKALHVRVAGVDYQSDADYLTAKAKVADVEIYFEEISFEPDRNERRSPCFLCAWHRRKALFDLAQRLGCNKIALGHHNDDVIETFIMNLFKEGRIGCFAPVTYLSKKNITMIRPLVFAPEAKVTNCCNRNGFPVCKSRCPADKKTTRQTTKEWLYSMEKQDKGFKIRMFGAIRRSGVDGWGFKNSHGNNEVKE